MAPSEGLDGPIKLSLPAGRRDYRPDELHSSIHGAARPMVVIGEHSNRCSASKLSCALDGRLPHARRLFPSSELGCVSLPPQSVALGHLRLILGPMVVTASAEWSKGPGESEGCQIRNTACGRSFDARLFVGFTWKSCVQGRGCPSQNGVRLRVGRQGLLWGNKDNKPSLKTSRNVI